MPMAMRIPLTINLLARQHLSHANHNQRPTPMMQTIKTQTMISSNSKSKTSTPPRSTKKPPPHADADQTAANEAAAAADRPPHPNRQSKIHSPLRPQAVLRRIQTAKTKTGPLVAEAEAEAAAEDVDADAIAMTETKTKKIASLLNQTTSISNLPPP
jgi:hypothetical protein